MKKILFGCAAVLVLAACKKVEGEGEKVPSLEKSLSQKNFMLMVLTLHLLITMGQKRMCILFTVTMTTYMMIK